MSKGVPTCPFCNTTDINTEIHNGCKCPYVDLTCVNGHEFYDNYRGGYTKGRVHPNESASFICFAIIFVVGIAIALVTSIVNGNNKFY